MPNDKSTAQSSAAGERRALTGLLPQYRLAASLILSALRHHQLEFVEITHDLNGAVDDVVIGTPLRVDAYQVKWREQPKAIGFRALVKPDRDKRTIIRDLYEGWKSLATRFPSKRAVVNFYTCDYPSTEDKLGPKGQHPPLTSAAFLDQVWYPAQRGDLAGVHAQQHAWHTIVAASSASEADFLSFAKDCRFTFGARQPIEASDETRDAVYVADQLRELAELLKELAINPQRVHHFERRQLLTRLNWTRFFELRNRHEFSVTPAYEEIAEPASRLRAALDNLSGGYLFVGGSPGSGKSSLLTRTFEQRAARERWIRYYAFVPGSPEPGNTRGEAENFLHDISTALEDAGIASGQSHSNFDRQQLIERLGIQLRRLGDEFHRSGTRTVLLVDGLDHVPREQRPDRSMLKDLPHPDRVPPGVFVVLGSQTDQLPDIPPSVRAAIAAAERRVLMEPLPPPAILAVIRRAELAVELDAEQDGAIARLSQGHPLALALLLNHLRTAPDPQTVDEILGSTAPYAGHIDALYRSYWDEIYLDDDLVHLLAMLGRLRRHIDVRWVHSFASPGTMARLKRQFSHLFHREADDRWFFFHNSFALFVRVNTATLVAGTSTENDRLLHRTLAGHCAKAPSGSPWRWEQQFHLGEAGEHDTVLKLATAEAFRQQLHDMRPCESVLDDVRLAIKSAGVIRDPVALVRLTLCAAEFSQRASGVDGEDIARVLLRLGEVDRALEYIFDGRELRVSNKRALANSRLLKAMERDSEARRLFELAGPLTTQIRSDGIDARDARESMESWVKTAVLFRPTSHIVSLIDSIRVEASPFQRTTEAESTRQVKASLTFHLVEALRELDREAEASVIESTLNTDALRRSWWFWLQVRAWRRLLDKGDREAASASIHATLELLPPDSLVNDQRVLLAEGLYRTVGESEELDFLLKTIEQPASPKDYIGDVDLFSTFADRFRLNRLLRALGRDEPPTKLVPDSPDPSKRGLVYLERAVIRIAFLWGDAWRHRYYSSGDLRQHVSDILRFFNRNVQERRAWSSWTTLAGSSRDLYVLLVDAVAQHGPNVVSSLATLFVNEWEHERRGRTWTATVRRDVILALHGAGVDHQFVIDQLRSIEPLLLEGQDVSGRVRECFDQAEAWARLHQHDRAIDWLKAMFDTSFGVGYRKDYQLESWMDWLPIIGNADPSGIPQRMAWFAAAAQSLDESTEGRSALDGAEKLIGMAAAWSPRRAVTLLDWFEEQGPVRYDASVSRLLEALLDRGTLSAPVARAGLEFLLRFSTETNATLAESYVRHGRRTNVEEASAEVAGVYNVVATLALPSTRASWVAGLTRGLAALGVASAADMPTPVESEAKSGSTALEHRITLRDGSDVGGEELKRRASTVDGLCHLAAQATDAYFRWSTYFEEVAQGATLAELRRLATAAAGLKEQAMALAAVSRKQTMAGDRSAGWDTALKAFEASRDFGWTRWGDGGTRVESLAALVAADPSRGRAIALDSFASDMSRRRSFPAEVVRNLLEIASLLFSDLPAVPLWEEISGYLDRLCPNMSMGAHPDLSETPACDTADRAVVDLLSRHLYGPLHLLMYGAQHGIGNLLLRSNADAVDVVKGLLKSDADDKILGGLGLLEAVAKQANGDIAAFRENLIKLTRHGSYPIWYGSRDLLARLGVEAPGRPHRSLPAIYSLELPGDDEVRHPLRHEPVDGEPLPDPLSHLEALTPIDQQLIAIAALLGMPAINLLHRTRQLMDELSDFEQWSAAAENRLRSRLDRAELKFTFQRPRGQVARRAMFHAISELSDAGQLTAQEARFVSEVLRPSDPALCLAHASRRPQEIGSVEGLTAHADPKPKWVMAVRSTPLRSTPTLGDRIVAGESTELRRLSWEVPTIQIASAISLRRPGSDDDLWASYNFINSGQYLSVGHDAVPSQSIIVSKTFDGRDSDCGRWIAINPQLARALRWEPAQEGMFRWTDAAGRIMAETIWWKDCTLDHQPPKHDDEVGEGWLVVISRLAIGQLVGRFGRLFRTVQNERRLRSDGSLQTLSHRAVEAFRLS